MWRHSAKKHELMITTARLRLVPATLELARAELASPTEFAQLLEATVPADWPPETLADALPLFVSWLEAAPNQVGWFGWYIIQSSDQTLIGSAGFKGPPQEQSVELGYSILPWYEGYGFATEAVRGLIEWAFSHPEVQQILAETEWANPASVRVLLKAGFRQIGPTSDSKGSRFILTAS